MPASSGRIAAGQELQEAVGARDSLLAAWREADVPHNFLDVLIDELGGPAAVAEMTGTGLCGIMSFVCVWVVRGVLWWGHRRGRAPFPPSRISLEQSAGGKGCIAVDAPNPTAVPCRHAGRKARIARKASGALVYELRARPGSAELDSLVVQEKNAFMNVRRFCFRGCGAWAGVARRKEPGRRVSACTATCSPDGGRHSGLRGIASIAAC